LQLGKSKKVIKDNALSGLVKLTNNNMSGDVKFEGTQEEWDALVKKNNEKGIDYNDMSWETIK